MMRYKGYVATFEHDDEAGAFHGEVINTRAVITFQATTVEQLQREMEASVDDYLEWCAQRGKEPEKPGRRSNGTEASTYRRGDEA